jgi:starch phosphorylase
MVDWRHTLERKWATLRFGEEKVATHGEEHTFEVRVYLNDLDPNAVRVELYADELSGCSQVRQEMTRDTQREDSSGGYLYHGTVPATRPATDYTARVIPHHDGVAVPLEAAHILWQR